MTTVLRQSSIGILFFVVAASTAPLAAQEQPQPRWKKSFGDVEVQTIHPEDLPDRDESVLPAALQARGALPRATSFETLRESAAKIGNRVIEVIVVPRNDSPLRQTPIVVRGEAVWLSAKPGQVDPVLVTDAHWLVDAEGVFIRPQPEKRGGALPQAERRTLHQMKVGADVETLLKDPTLIRVGVTAIDKHRNLATLVLPEGKTAPAAGLEFYPIETQSTSTAYGFSHQMGSALVQTQFVAPNGKRDELLFYLQTTYPVILGAPIVSDAGQVIAITAMRHPTEPELTLVIPPRALRHYVESVQGIDAPKSDKPETHAE